MAIDKAIDSVVLDAGLNSIANAIRAKSDTSAQLNFPDGFTDAVKAIQSAKPEQTKTVDITSNGTTTVTPDNSNVLSAVTVNVNVSSSDYLEDALVERSLTFYENNRVKTIGAYALFRANLTKVNFEMAEVIGTSAFEYCTKLTSVSFPKVKTVLSSVFANCEALQAAEFHEVESFSNSVFRYNKAFKTLIIRAPDKVCSLGNTDCFKFTQIESGTGYIYVPDNLVDQYKAATNWTFYANQIKPLSELPEVSA